MSACFSHEMNGAAVRNRFVSAFLASIFAFVNIGYSQSSSRSIAEPGPAPVVDASQLSVPSASSPTVSAPVNSSMPGSAQIYSPPQGTIVEMPSESMGQSTVVESMPTESVESMPVESSQWEACTCPACSGEPGADSCTMMTEADPTSCTMPSAGGCDCGCGCGGAKCGLGLFSECGCKCGKCGKQEAKKPAAKKDDKPTCKGSHKPLFYLNDFSYLDNPKYEGCCLGDNLKGIKFGGGGCTCGGCNCGQPTCSDPCCCSPAKKTGPKLDIGGQLRLRYHYERGMGRQAGFTRFQNTENNFGLLRLRLYTNLVLTENVRLFAEGIYADVIGANDEYLPRAPIDRNLGDLNNLFIDLKLTDSTKVRVGRQEIALGAQRLVSPLDWANTRRRFDGVRLMQKWDNFTLDSFYLNLVPVVFDEFDDFFQDNSKLYGAYGSYKGANDTLDLYYLGTDNDAAGSTLHTIGTRLLGGQGDWLYEFEGGVQLGDQDNLGLAHEGGFATAGIGRKFPNAVWKPTLWFYYDYASGNNIGGDFNNFNQLFPLAHKYLGFIDSVARTNVESPNILLTMNPGPKTKLLFWYYHLMSNQDTAAVPAIGDTPAQSTVSKDFGDELDILMSHAIGPRSTLVLGYSRLWRGNKILGDTDADFGYAQWHVNF